MDSRGRTGWRNGSSSSSWPAVEGAGGSKLRTTARHFNGQSPSLYLSCSSPASLLATTSHPHADLGECFPYPKLNYLWQDQSFKICSNINYGYLIQSSSYVVKKTLKTETKQEKIKWTWIDALKMWVPFGKKPDESVSKDTTGGAGPLSMVSIKGKKMKTNKDIQPEGIKYSEHYGSSRQSTIPVGRLSFVSPPPKSEKQHISKSGRLTGSGIIRENKEPCDRFKKHQQYHQQQKQLKQQNFERSIENASIKRNNQQFPFSNDERESYLNQLLKATQEPVEVAAAITVSPQNDFYSDCGEVAYNGANDISALVLDQQNKNKISGNAKSNEAMARNLSDLHLGEEEKFLLQQKSMTADAQASNDFNLPMGSYQLGMENIDQSNILSIPDLNCQDSGFASSKEVKMKPPAARSTRTSNVKERQRDKKQDTQGGSALFHTVKILTQEKEAVLEDVNVFQESETACADMDFPALPSADESKPEIVASYGRKVPKTGIFISKKASAPKRKLERKKINSYFRNQDVAERIQQKYMMMVGKLNNFEPAKKTAEQNNFKFEDYGFLEKYCILNKSNTEIYQHTFDAVDEENIGWLTASKTVTALHHVNNKLTVKEEKYLKKIVEMTGYNTNHGTDFKLFCVLAALSHRITALDKWMKNLIHQMDYKMFDMKIYKCKTLWECIVDSETKQISMDELSVELQAGGVSQEHEQEVLSKLKHLKSLDLLDFLTYVPLFIMIHESVIQNPLDNTRHK